MAQQIYLQQDLTLEELAQAIGTNRSYLSQYFSRQGITYNIYINNLRVNHFISLYEQAVAAGENVGAQQLAEESIESVQHDKDNDMTMEQMLEGYPYKRYTKAELNAMLDEAEAEIAAGGGIPDEEAWDDLEEELELEKQQELEMAEAL